MQFPSCAVITAGLALAFGMAIVPPVAAGPRPAAAPSASATAEPNAGEESPDSSACIAAYEKVQTMRDAGRLLEAREQAIACAGDQCPKVLASECAQWLGGIVQSIPTVVLGAQSPDGQDLVDVRVLIDAKPFLDKIGARAESVDPGSHVFRFESAEHGAAELRVLVREGERNRRIVAKFEKPPEPAPPAVVSSESNVGPAVGFTLGALGLVGIGVGVVFEAMGLSKASDLESCKPACPAEETDKMSRNFVIGDVSLIAGGVALAAGIVVLIASYVGEEPEAEPAASAHWVVVPTDHGALGVLTTRF